MCVGLSMKSLILSCLGSIAILSLAACSCDKPAATASQPAPMQTDTKNMQSPSTPPPATH